MDEIVGNWRSLSTKEEEGILGVDDRIVEKGKEGMSCCCWGRFYRENRLIKGIYERLSMTLEG